MDNPTDGNDFQVIEDMATVAECDSCPNVDELIEFEGEFLCEDCYEFAYALEYPYDD